jgi:hypothetical protein
MHLYLNPYGKEFQNGGVFLDASQKREMILGREKVFMWCNCVSTLYYI